MSQTDYSSTSSASSFRSLASISSITSSVKYNEDSVTSNNAEQTAADALASLAVRHVETVGARVEPVVLCCTKENVEAFGNYQGFERPSFFEDAGEEEPPRPFASALPDRTGTIGRSDAAGGVAVGAGSRAHGDSRNDDWKIAGRRDRRRRRRELRLRANDGRHDDSDE